MINNKSVTLKFEDTLISFGTGVWQDFNVNKDNIRLTIVIMKIMKCLRIGKKFLRTANTDRVK